MTADTAACAGADVERVRYFEGQLLTADDTTTEQEYFRQKLRRRRCWRRRSARPGPGVAASTVDRRLRFGRQVHETGGGLPPHGVEPLVGLLAMEPGCWPPTPSSGNAAGRR